MSPHSRRSFQRRPPPKPNEATKQQHMITLTCTATVFTACIRLPYGQWNQGPVKDDPIAMAYAVVLHRILMAKLNELRCEVQLPESELPALSWPYLKGGSDNTVMVFRFGAPLEFLPLFSASKLITCASPCTTPVVFHVSSYDGESHHYSLNGVPPAASIEDIHKMLLQANLKPLAPPVRRSITTEIGEEVGMRPLGASSEVLVNLGKRPHERIRVRFASPGVSTANCSLGVLHFNPIASGHPPCPALNFQDESVRKVINDWAHLYPLAAQALRNATPPPPSQTPAAPQVHTPVLSKNGRKTPSPKKAHDTGTPTKVSPSSGAMRKVSFADILIMGPRKPSSSSMVGTQDTPRGAPALPISLPISQENRPDESMVPSVLSQKRSVQTAGLDHTTTLSRTVPREGEEGSGRAKGRFSGPPRGGGVGGGRGGGRGQVTQQLSRVPDQPPNDPGPDPRGVGKRLSSDTAEWMSSLPLAPYSPFIIGKVVDAMCTTAFTAKKSEEVMVLRSDLVETLTRCKALRQSSIERASKVVESTLLVDLDTIPNLGSNDVVNRLAWVSSMVFQLHRALVHDVQEETTSSMVDAVLEETGGIIGNDEHALSAVHAPIAGSSIEVAPPSISRSDSGSYGEGSDQDEAYKQTLEGDPPTSSSEDANPFHEPPGVGEEESPTLTD
jgi:hypothetical protein